MAPMSNAERQRKYRERLKQNPEKHEEKKRKHREYMKSKRKPIEELTEKEKEKKRQEWRNAKKTKKDCGVTKQNKKECCALNARLCSKLRKQLNDKNKFIETLLLQKRALQKQVYRQKIKINKLSQLTTNTGTPNVIASQGITASSSISLETKFNGESIHENIESSDTTGNVELVTPEIENQITPMTKTISFINENIPSISTPEKNKVKKQILQLNVINTSLQTAYKKQDNKSKQILKDIVSSETVEKYNLKTEISKCLGLKGRVRKFKKKDGIRKEAKEIREFLNRDDNTRMTAGKKECIGRGKDKLQKRFLLASLKKLYTNYVAEGGKTSFSTFRRNKPNNVVRPKLSDRNTVACIKHSNLSFKSAQLKKIGVINTADLEELLASSVCSIQSLDCMYLKCEKCKDNIPELNLTKITDETECTWLQWIRKAFTFEKGTERKKTTTMKYVKEITKGTFLELKTAFISDLLTFRKHFFNINHQHKKYREVIDNLLPNEVALIVDFSENYNCKLAEEIQALHFGASKGQITIHTGMAYLRTNKIPFASLSDVNDHDPGAIRAHIEPIIELLIKNNPDIDTIHFFSDGPSTQYKQKKNFYQFSQICKKYNFIFGTWSFFEAAHGKGAADGVGGAVKRLLDQSVACGNDVSCVEDAVSILIAESSVKIFAIAEKEIRYAQNQIPDDLIPVPGTNQIHQISYHVPSSTLRYRNVSCFCQSSLPRGNCECYNSKSHILTKDLAKKNKKCTRNFRKRSNKNNKPAKPKSRRKFCDTDSTTSTDTDITYAESDNSCYAAADEQSIDDYDDVNGVIQTEMNIENYLQTYDLHNENSNNYIVGSCSDDQWSNEENSDINDNHGYNAIGGEFEFAVNDWVVLQLQYGKNTKIIGQIINKTHFATYKISCLSYVKPFTFAWHKTWCEEILEVPESKIIHKLSSKAREEDGYVIFNQIPMWDYE